MTGYDDIINLPHPDPKKHPRMSRIARAAQFGAFRALTGHEEAIDEVARITDNKIDLDECEIDIINKKLSIISDCIKENPEVTITYFEPDSKKSGGQSIIHTGCVKKIDVFNGKIIMCDNTQISMDMILNIRAELFDCYDLI